eukprot:CAMPEP_0174759600 /NCGR_PEP_ID=MMETSP1094-20130205/108352_1 /TAXON_ID=156173 /ORGANISM="Chrysochromulina brevifilum, Strain UTEX LB 985" /LENGTH=52 /DNA_ID=CAMNT_0015965537 /DNA_START=1235 /DNA_END=1390 /DNA_ORIENTATION=-
MCTSLASTSSTEPGLKMRECSNKKRTVAPGCAWVSVHALALSGEFGAEVATW